MIPILTGLVLLSVLAATLWSFNHAGLFIANNAQIVNITAKGRGTKLAGPSVTFGQRYLIASRNPADGEQYILPYVAGTNPFAVVDDQTPSTDSAPSDYPLTIDILGMCEDTKRGIAAGVIAIDNLVYPVAGGTLASLATAAAGTYYVVGKAIVGTTTGANDQIEFVPCFPYQVTIA